MKQWQNTYNKYIISYHNRMMVMLAVVLILTILIFKYINFGMESDLNETSAQDIIIDNVMITEFASAQPVAPRRPIVNPIEPIDEVIDDEIILDVEGLLTDARMELPGSGTGDIIQNPDQPPRVRRIVEAVTPQEFRTSETRYIVFVTMTINTEGRVEEAFISEVLKVSTDGTSQEIQTAPQSIVSESLRAAYGWVFTPAISDNKPVKSNSIHRFVFGG